MDHRARLGTFFTLEILETYYGSEDAAEALETFWIKKYRDLGFELNNVKKKAPSREVRGYKIKDSVYKKAMERAKKEGTTLAALIEKWVIAYSEGKDLFAIHPNTGEAVKVDIRPYKKQLRIHQE